MMKYKIQMEGDLIIFFYAWFVVWYAHGTMKELWLSHVRRVWQKQAQMLWVSIPIATREFTLAGKQANRQTALGEYNADLPFK